MPELSGAFCPECPEAKWPGGGNSWLGAHSHQVSLGETFRTTLYGWEAKHFCAEAILEGDSQTTGFEKNRGWDGPGTVGWCEWSWEQCKNDLHSPRISSPDYTETKPSSTEQLERSCLEQHFFWNSQGWEPQMAPFCLKDHNPIHGGSALKS